MELVTLATLRAHCRADGDDDDLIIMYANAALAACVTRISRDLFPDVQAQNAALATVGTLLTEAWDAYDQAMEDADAIEDERVRAAMKIAAIKQRDNAIRRANMITNGIVATEDIKAAIMLTVKTWRDNGTSVVTGQGAAAVELPGGAESILARHEYKGD